MPTYESFMRLPVILLALLLATNSFAEPPAAFERVLVPVLNPERVVYGANGSQFRTNVGIDGFGNAIAYYPAPADGPSVGTTNPGTITLPLWEAPEVLAKGRFLFLEARPYALFAEVVSLTIVPVNGAATTPLPVVRERVALTGASVIGLLPFDAQSDAFPPAFRGYRQRHTLRIYEFGTTGTMLMRLRLRMVAPVMRAPIERIVAVSSRDVADVSYPFYYEANLEQLFDSPCGPHPHGLCGPFRAVLDVEPLGEGRRYYAFVSTTENDTNHVTMYLPQPRE